MSIFLLLLNLWKEIGIFSKAGLVDFCPVLFSSSNNNSNNNNNYSNNNNSNNNNNN